MVFLGCSKSNDNEKAITYNNMAIEMMMKDNSYPATLTAIQYLDSAIALDSNLLTAYSNKVNYLFYLKEFEKALAVLEISQRKAPNQPEIYLNRAMAFRAIRRIEESEYNLRICLKLSENLSSYSNKVIYYSAYVLLYDKERAIRKLEEDKPKQKITEKDYEEIKKIIIDFNIWEFENNISN